MQQSESNCSLPLGAKPAESTEVKSISKITDNKSEKRSDPVGLALSKKKEESTTQTSFSKTSSRTGRSARNSEKNIARNVPSPSRKSRRTIQEPLAETMYRPSTKGETDIGERKHQGSSNRKGSTTSPGSSRRSITSPLTIEVHPNSKVKDVSRKSEKKRNSGVLGLLHVPEPPHGVQEHKNDSVRAEKPATKTQPITEIPEEKTKVISENQTSKVEVDESQKRLKDDSKMGENREGKTVESKREKRRHLSKTIEKLQKRLPVTNEDTASAKGIGSDDAVSTAKQVVSAEGAGSSKDVQENDDIARIKPASAKNESKSKDKENDNSHGNNFENIKDACIAKDVGITENKPSSNDAVSTKEVMSGQVETNPDIISEGECPETSQSFECEEVYYTKPVDEVDHEQDPEVGSKSNEVAAKSKPLVVGSEVFKAKSMRLDQITGKLSIQRQTQISAKRDVIKQKLDNLKTEEISKNIASSSYQQLSPNSISPFQSIPNPPPRITPPFVERYPPPSLLTYAPSHCTGPCCAYPSGGASGFHLSPGGLPPQVDYPGSCRDSYLVYQGTSAQPGYPIRSRAPCKFLLKIL